MQEKRPPVPVERVAGSNRSLVASTVIVIVGLLLLVAKPWVGNVDRPQLDAGRRGGPGSEPAGRPAGTGIPTTSPSGTGSASADAQPGARRCHRATAVSEPIGLAGGDARANRLDRIAQPVPDQPGWSPWPGGPRDHRGNHPCLAASWDRVLHSNRTRSRHCRCRTPHPDLEAVGRRTVRRGQRRDGPGPGSLRARRGVSRPAARRIRHHMAGRPLRLRDPGRRGGRQQRAGSRWTLPRPTERGGRRPGWPQMQRH